MQTIGELKIIGRIGEDEIDALVRHTLHERDAVAAQNVVARRRAERPFAGAPDTRDLNSGFETSRSDARATHELHTIYATDRRDSEGGR